ncbi:MAG: response regulator transcription factor [Jannaschia sp.]
MRKISTVLADDHELSSAGLQLALAAHGAFECVGRAVSGPEAMDMILRLEPDLAVLDYSMPGANGLEVFHRVRPRLPATKVAILTGNPAPTVRNTLRDAGVSGVFLKSGPIDALIAGLHAVALGSVDHFPDCAGSEDALGLSAREFEVLCKTAQGLTVRAIAEALSISPKTVETHKTSLMRKMGVSTTAELIVSAIKADLVDLS